MKIEMTTLVKKAREYVEGVMSNSRSPMGMYLENDMIGIGIQCYEVGYNEAMRWRDVKEELPENEEIVQVKCHSNNETWYEQLRYLKAHNVWACDQTIGDKVVGWKPIE
ncbi:MAG: hypothetical protein PHQ67_01440 [Fermentimonas sp.]|nr:hypothetical protein [Fermentimonas sp.]MDD4696906.1 hypothetical protein [Fermentimonas sp.]